MSDRYYLPLTKAMLWALSAVVAVTVAGFAGIEAGADSGVPKMEVKHFDVFDIINEQRVRFVAEHGVADPSALVASVRHSPMANLLISIAIEESRGDPVAVGAAGERGAWQVIASNWGSVPKDLHGQASQAERIISALLDRCNGNKIKALAWYNGGTTPPGKSYRYAKRILKRAGYLQVAVNYLPPKGDKLRTTLPGSLGSSWLL
ncbi:MAG: lytic transglycosylase domain-containing protein [Desulfuromonadaceae bacterium]|nr:lytic transglycosylase domain-containing protein [Desulfuromonadaceae bacterium]